MKAKSNVRPTSNFVIEKYSDKEGEACVVIFYENITESSTSYEVDGETVTGKEYEYDDYRITVPYRANLEESIVANYDDWIQRAKNEESKEPEKTPVEKIVELEDKVQSLQQENQTLNSVIETLIISSLEAGV